MKNLIARYRGAAKKGKAFAEPITLSYLLLKVRRLQLARIGFTARVRSRWQRLMTDLIVDGEGLERRASSAVDDRIDDIKARAAELLTEMGFAQREEIRELNENIAKLAVSVEKLINDASVMSVKLDRRSAERRAGEALMATQEDGDGSPSSEATDRRGVDRRIA